MFGAKDAYIIISNQLKAMNPRTYKKQERAINKTLGYKQLPAFGIFKLVLTISITQKFSFWLAFVVQTTGNLLSEDVRVFPSKVIGYIRRTCRTRFKLVFSPLQR